MDLLAYFRVLRRRWWVIAVCVLLGVGLGLASTLVDSSNSAAPTAKSSRSYYKATAILLKANPPDNVYPTTFDTIDQMAVFATAGPVPDAVAKQLGNTESGPQLAEQITTLTNGDTNTLAITAIDPSSDRAQQLADTFADQLVANLAASDLQSYQQATADATDLVNTLQGKIDALIAQIAATPPPPNVDLLQSQLRALENQSGDAYGHFEDLASQRPPVSPLTTLQKARPLRISADEYATKLHLGEQGENNLQAGDQVATATAGSSVTGVSLDSTTARGVVGGVLGLFVGLALAVLLERLDRRIRTRADAELAFALPVIGEVPKFSSKEEHEHGVVTASKPLSPVAEAYRAVRSSLLFERATLAVGSTGSNDLPTAVEPNGNGDDHDADDGRHEPLVVMVTSATPSDGKTTTAANLAVVFAEAGSSVLVVNCDFRRPMIHEHFDVSDEPRRVHRTTVPGVRVVSNVTLDQDVNPAQVIRMQRQVIAAARAKFDVLILDTAPLLGANDALEMAAEADLVVLVARSGWTKFPAAQRAIDMLGRVDAPVVGTILVGVGARDDRYYTYYGDRREASLSRRWSSHEAPGANGNGSGRASGSDLVLSDSGFDEFSDD